MRQFSEYPPARRILLFFSSGFLTGYIPFASGTFGSAVAIALFYPFRAINVPRRPEWFFFCGLLAVVAVVAVGLAEIAERIYGEKDSHKIVVDEIAGFFVSMAFVPFRPLPVAAAFLLFRIFDVLKPPPIRRLQELRGGLGVVVDDLLAGVYACVVVHVLILLQVVR